jgi:uncharacterized membrane protein
MDWIFYGLLFLHVAGAILAFGPTYAFAFFGPMGGREPQHLNFALRLQERIASRLVLPLAIFQSVTGLALVWRLGFDLLTKGWLLLGITLYLIALLSSIFVLVPTLAKLIEATSTPPPAPEPGAPPRSGPPPHIAALVKRGKTISMMNAVLILVVVFLMVTKPF